MTGTTEIFDSKEDLSNYAASNLSTKICYTTSNMILFFFMNTWDVIMQLGRALLNSSHHLPPMAKLFDNSTSVGIIKVKENNPKYSTHTSTSITEFTVDTSITFRKQDYGNSTCWWLPHKESSSPASLLCLPYLYKKNTCYTTIEQWSIILQPAHSPKLCDHTLPPRMVTKLTNKSRS